MTGEEPPPELLSPGLTIQPPSPAASPTFLRLADTSSAGSSSEAAYSALNTPTGDLSPPLHAAPRTYDALPEEDGGDVGNAELVARRRRKGKGRMTDLEELDEERTENGGGQNAQEVEYDEEAEERRILENLSKWSHAEKKRRQAHRKTSSLVLPSPPISGAQLTNLSRRSSALFRNPSRRTASDSKVQDADLAHQLEDRRTSRKTSIRLPDLVGEPPSGGPSAAVAASTPLQRLEGLAEDDEDAGDTEKDHTTSTNPFHSRPSLEPTRSSRFIEDLPSQATSPTQSDPSSALHRSSQFDDIVVRSSERPPLSPAVKRVSQQSLASIDSVPSAPHKRSESLGSSHALVSPLVSTFPADVGRAQPRAKPWMTRTNAADAQRLHQYDEDEEEEAQVETSGIGVLDWILCGCFRAEGDRDGDQAGRTNPNE